MAGALKSGTKVRVREGVSAPDLSRFSIAGWTGTVTDISKRGGGVRYFIEWDGATLAAISDEYRENCEAKQLYYAMACLTDDEIDPVE